MSRQPRTKHVSANDEDNMEEAMEGTPENFGSIDDWETEAVLKMRKLLKGQSAMTKNEPDDAEELVERKLSLYRAVLKLMNDNPKLAMQLGNKGGFQAIMSYVLKKGIAYAAEKEIEPYAKAVAAYLPGSRIAAMQAEGVKAGGFANADRKATMAKFMAKAPAVVDL